jgi:hypothetical protein
MRTPYHTSQLVGAAILMLAARPCLANAGWQTFGLDCGAGVGLGASTFNYARGYADLQCARLSGRGSWWHPGAIFGIEGGLVGWSLAAGFTLQDDADWVVTLPGWAFLVRGRLMFPFGVLGWDPTARYGVEIGFQVIFLRGTVGAIWMPGHSTPGILLAVDFGLL